jgi:hypothetical protein
MDYQAVLCKFNIKEILPAICSYFKRQQGGQTPANEPQKPHLACPLPRFVVFCYPNMSRPRLNGMADLKYIRRHKMCFRSI